MAFARLAGVHYLHKEHNLKSGHKLAEMMIYRYFVEKQEDYTYQDVPEAKIRKRRFCPSRNSISEFM